MTLEGWIASSVLGLKVTFYKIPHSSAPGRSLVSHAHKGAPRFSPGGTRQVRFVWNVECFLQF